MDTKTPFEKLITPQGIALAYRLQQGDPAKPTLVFCGGYTSNMLGSKATFLAGFCAIHNISLLRFDYAGHGESGGVFKDGCIGDWLEDARAIITHTVKGEMILIGSSMGGWIALLLAQHLQNRITGFIGIAAAPDFTQWVWDKHMSQTQRDFCSKNGFIEDEHGQMMTLRLFEDGKNHLILDKKLPMPYPVILLQGKLDAEVPYKLAYRLAENITPTQAEVILIEDGDHRLAREQDLEALGTLIKKMID
ncbi:MAG: alpha/beta hydrolase [Pseudobdellovibrionaceae bacterium]